MTTITAPGNGQTRRRDIRTVLVAGLTGMAVGATLAVVVPRLTTADSPATSVTSPALTQRYPAIADLNNSTLRDQVPHAAVVWLISRASSYRVGGSTYNQQVPYAARHAAADSWTNQNSTYREQVPAFK